MPTLEGIWWLGAVFLLMLMGWGYANNLCLALAVLLLSLSVIFLIECHFNLEGLNLQLMSYEDQFAQRRLRWKGAYRSRSQRTRHNLKLRWDTKEQLSSEIKILPDHFIEGEFIFPYSKKWDSPFIIIESRYPMGLFRAWSFQKIDNVAWVYPEPILENESTQVSHSSESETERYKISSSGDEPHESKFFETGDSSNRIDWKYYARTQSLRLKTYLEHESKLFYYSWPYLAGDEYSKKILTGHIQRHSQREEKFGFKIGSLELPPEIGPHHVQTVLRAITEAKV